MARILGFCVARETLAGQPLIERVLRAVALRVSSQVYQCRR